MGEDQKKILANDISQDVYDLFDDYVHSSMGRREFMNQLKNYATAGLSAAAMAEFLLPDYAKATQVDPKDPRLKSEYIEYSSPKGAGKMKALLTRPVKTDGKLPGIVVVHENRGLNPYIEDVARRLGIENFIALAPDALTPLGGYPGNDDEGREMQSKRNRDEMVEDFIAAYHYLKALPDCSGRVGVVGFCFGGYVVNQLAVRLPDLDAAVPFYGTAPDVDAVPKINAPLLLHFAGLDTRVNGTWPAYEAALKKNKKEYTAYIYPDVNHGFHNDTTPRYDKPAAELAWKRTVEFFNEHLR
jgi:carboxymethylenebutenolidase